MFTNLSRAWSCWTVKRHAILSIASFDQFWDTQTHIMQCHLNLLNISWIPGQIHFRLDMKTTKLCLDYRCFPLEGAEIWRWISFVSYSRNMLLFALYNGNPNMHLVFERCIHCKLSCYKTSSLLIS